MFSDDYFVKLSGRSQYNLDDWISSDIYKSFYRNVSQYPMWTCVEVEGGNNLSLLCLGRCKGCKDLAGDKVCPGNEGSGRSVCVTDILTPISRLRIEI